MQDNDREAKKQGSVQKKGRYRSSIPGGVRGAWQWAGSDFPQKYIILNGRIERVDLEEPIERIHSIAEIGALVKKARKNLNITQQQLAVWAGVGRRVVSELERGSKDTIEFGRVLSICQAVGIDFSAKIR